MLLQLALMEGDAKLVANSAAALVAMCLVVPLAAAMPEAWLDWPGGQLWALLLGLPVLPQLLELRVPAMPLAGGIT